MKFYLLQENENGLYSCEDVSQNTEKIYSMLYKPLETLWDGVKANETNR